MSSKGVNKMDRIKKIFIIPAALIIFLSMLAGCAARKTAASTNKAPMSGNYARDETLSVATSDETAYRPVSAEKPSSLGAEVAQGIAGTGFSVTSSDVEPSRTLDILAQRKVIRNANLSLEVDDFYAAYGNLQAMITGIGYISESNIHRDFYTYENERKARVTGEITIRIDARRFDSILNDIKGLGEVIDDRIYSTDITDQYFDTEGRLKVLKIEYEYLEEYIRSLTKPEDIFKTRTQMTELQTEIERLTGTLNKWSDLVELSTIYIRMTEKYPEAMTKKQNNTYWNRVQSAFNSSIAGIIEALGDLFIFIIQAIPVLVVLAVICWIGYRIVRRIIKNLKKINGEKLQNKVESDLKPQTEDSNS